MSNKDKTIEATLKIPFCKEFLSTMESQQIKDGWYNLNVKLKFVNSKLFGYSDGVLKPVKQ